jgi:ABC-type uncharacterized transport system substrate-binding protein
MSALRTQLVLVLGPEGVYPADMKGYRALWAIGVTLVLSLYPVPPAEPHPHAWVDTRATLRFDDQSRLVAIVEEWVFDDVYTAYVVEDLGEPKKVTSELLQPLADQNVAELKEWGYFTVFKADGGRVTLGPAMEARMTYAGERLTLSFTLPLPKPLDPRDAAVAFSIFDPTFYIEIVPAEEMPVKLDGRPPEGCSAKHRPLDMSEERFVPDSLALSINTDPNDPENAIGARFAEWIDLSCEKPS